MAAFLTRRKFLLMVAAILVAGGIFLAHPAHTHLRAMSVLLRFSDPKANGFGVRFAQHPFEEQTGSAQGGSAQFRYRIYKPQDVNNPGGMVLLHGVHRLGIDEPRLVSFARTLASAGIEVLTPELRDLADYRVTSQTVDQIGVAAVILSTRMNRPKVGVMGLSFAGGLALLAAAKPEYAGNIAFVVAVGAHDDLGRVSRFFATDRVEKPDGSSAPLPAHEYGILVLAYSHLEDFFSPLDVPIAREALRRWLGEHPDAMKKAEPLSPAGHAELDLLLHHRDQLRQKLLEEVKLHAGEMAAVSPHGQLGHLTVPVFLLHGSGDSVIPATETQWLAQDVPRPELKEALVSPALIHVNMEETVPFSQKWDLVHFLAKVVGAADETGTMSATKALQ